MSTIAKLIKSGSPLVDVRTEEEFNNGHVDGAVNIPLNTIPSKINELKKLGQPLVFCCMSGGRSDEAVKYLRKRGFTDVHNVGGWKEAKHIKYSL